tara:strand:+ start:4692 stop:5876 length:1185 start_codon:yes stop_codon:yes gene_type:complete
MKNYLFLLLALLFSSSFAQNQVHQVLILNEGLYGYDSPVTVGSFDPLTQNYTTVAEIDSSRFASDLIIDSTFFYVAADNKILKYDLDTYELITEVALDGVRKLAIYNNHLFVSRGDYDPITWGPMMFNSYLQIYDKSDLTLVSELDTLNGPKGSTESLIVNEDFVYVGINNGFASIKEGLVGVINGNSFDYMSEFDLGDDGKNPDNMMLNNNNLYTVNNKDWAPGSGSSISQINLETGVVVTKNIAAAPTGCGTSCLRAGKIVYQISQDVKLFQWDPELGEDNSSEIGSFENFYELAEDKINSKFYASSTDYATYGNIHIYDENYNLESTITTGISPGTIVFDVRQSLNLEELEIPNFTNQSSIFDVLGRAYGINDDRPAGIYIVNGKKVFLSE